ncbi:hypothetical protein TVAG_283060 [Trichomonas vaginalis G3]|uniref:Uncharacterized protein n=1 Tax=Trichomonas vaginalis (strain ATCC PRA-98 / G3) TaxID=412133 RepID=A2DEK9_TRIV3|nr:regulation of ARF protein signal transduction [Trichomonas vaginalis G3]EAY21136.1 hypothetical protein TVAG_283060 [Trichomonas vaginalis G3]KAI5522339.1 regulation of ARF protein signal transduction [Trichomonas vaginalis G3]|eukprot:XP_001582122.1 hypothetical protein [Trichomonas vaginalis G3]
MGLSANLIEEIYKYIDLLNSSLGMFSDKDLKYQVQQIQKFYHKGISPDNFDLDSVVYPFILACNSNKTKYGNLTLDFMISLFKFSSSELYPSIELAKNLLSLAILISKDSNYETSIKSIQFVNLIFSSYAGFHVVIGELLGIIYKILIYASNSHEYKNTDKELIDNVLSAGIRFIIMRSLDTSVNIHIDNFNNYAKTILNNVYEDSSDIVKDVQEPNDQISILDLDMIAIYHSLFELIESENLKRTTVNQIAMLICRSMNTEIDFWKKPFAKEMAKEFIIPVYEEIVAATNSKMNLELPCSFASIIWEKFDLITDHKQLIIQISFILNQNNDEMFYYACEMLKKLSQSPEFLVSILNSQIRNGNKTILSIFKDICDVAMPKSDVVSHKQQEAMIVLGKLLNSFDKLMKRSFQQPKRDRNNEKLLCCADIFSNNYQKGLDLFIENNFCDYETIGEFLYKIHDYIDKLRLGELLSLGDIEIFNQFIEFLPKNNVCDLINELFRYILIPRQKEVFENLIRRISHLIHEDFLSNDEKNI